jgi:hypothetical protein
MTLMRSKAKLANPLPDELINTLAKSSNFRVYRSVANVPDLVR